VNTPRPVTPSSITNRHLPEDQTSESIPFASTGSRVVALFIDCGIAFWIVFALGEALKTNAAEWVGLVIALIYFVGKDALLRGKSIGKLLTGLYIVRRSDLGKVSLQALIVRNLPVPLVLVCAGVMSVLLFYLAPELLHIGGPVTFFFGLAYIFGGVDGKDHATIGDRWADTVVIKRWKWAAVQSASSGIEEVSERAERGDKDAQFNLGFMYVLGQGVQQDQVSALKWFNLAAATGHNGAKDARDSLRRTMSDREVAEAQRLSREMLEKIQVKQC